MNQQIVPSSVGRFLATIGSICLLGPVAAFVFTAYTLATQLGMGSSSSGMDQAVHSVLTATMIGLAVGMLGVALVCIAIYVLRFAAPWLGSALMVGAVSLLPAIPIGTVLAFVLFRARHRQSQLLSRLTVA